MLYISFLKTTRFLRAHTCIYTKQSSFGLLRSDRIYMYRYFLVCSESAIGSGWMDLLRFVWVTSDGRDQRKERWRSWVAGREELPVTRRNERYNSHTKKRKKGEEEEEENALRPTNKMAPSHAFQKGLAYRPVVFSLLCVLSALFVGSRNTHSTHCHGRHPFHPSYLVSFCCSAALRSVSVGHKRGGRVFNGQHTRRWRRVEKKECPTTEVFFFFPLPSFFSPDVLVEFFQMQNS